MQTFFGVLGFGLAATFAYTIIGDWERSGHLIVNWMGAVVCLGILTLGVVLYLSRRHQATTPPSPATPQAPALPYGRNGNIIVMPAQPQAPAFHDFALTASGWRSENRPYIDLID